jgi:membrane-associated phospholipid phosphatase
MMQALVSPELVEGKVIYQISPFTIRTLLCVSLFLSYFFGSIIKYLYRKPRPVVVIPKNFLQKLDASSFPSIHTSNSLIVAFYAIFMLMFAGLYANPLYSILLSIVWFLYFIAVSLSRIALQKHYPIDVL